MGLNALDLMGASNALTPHAVIKVNGLLVASGFNSRLISVSVEDKSGVTSDTISIELRDGDPFVEIPKKGDLAEVWLGYKEAGVAYFGKFTIDDPEISMFPFKISISGKGADMRDNLKSQKSRHWDNKTLKEIVSEIAEDHNLEPRIDEKIGGLKYEWLGQEDESDIHFCERLAKKHGAIFSVKDGKLIFSQKGSDKSTTGKQLTAIIARPENIINGSAKVKFSYRSKFKNVTAHIQNKNTAQRDTVSEESDVEGTADYDIAEPFATKEEAQAAAKAKATELKSKTATTSVSLLGDPTIRSGAPFKYENCRPEVDDIEFNIETASHKISKSGYTVDIEANLNAEKDNEKKKTKQKTKKKASQGKGMHDLDWSDVENK